LKNEATDFVENKGPVLGGIRNEATAESSRQSAESSRQHQTWSARCNRRKSSGWQEKLMADGLKAECFLKNEATDLIENKGSAFDTIRNEATVWGSRRKAEGKEQ